MRLTSPLPTVHLGHPPSFNILRMHQPRHSRSILCITVVRRNLTILHTPSRRRLRPYTNLRILKHRMRRRSLLLRHLKTLKAPGGISPHRPDWHLRLSILTRKVSRPLNMVILQRSSTNIRLASPAPTFPSIMVPNLWMPQRFKSGPVQAIQNCQVLSSPLLQARNHYRHLSLSLCQSPRNAWDIIPQFPLLAQNG